MQYTASPLTPAVCKDRGIWLAYLSKKIAAYQSIDTLKISMIGL